jgi:hypothetical protein
MTNYLRSSLSDHLATNYIKIFVFSRTIVVDIVVRTQLADPGRDFPAGAASSLAPCGMDGALTGKRRQACSHAFPDLLRAFPITI